MTPQECAEQATQAQVTVLRGQRDAALAALKERDDARDLARKLWHALSLDHHGVNRSARQPVVREALDAYEMTAKNWVAS